jgi:hypothetical protein
MMGNVVGSDEMDEDGWALNRFPMRQKSRKRRLPLSSLGFLVVIVQPRLRCVPVVV